MDSGLSLHPHAGAAGALQPGANANHQMLAHTHAHLAAPQTHAPAAQDMSTSTSMGMYPAQHYAGASSDCALWGKHHALQSQVEHHAMAGPHHGYSALGLHGHRAHAHSIPTLGQQGIGADASAIEHMLHGTIPPGGRAFGGDGGVGDTAHGNIIEMAGNDGFYNLGMFGGWPSLPRDDKIS